MEDERKQAQQYKDQVTRKPVTTETATETCTDS